MCGVIVGLHSGRSGDRILARVRFSAPVQIGPGAHRVFSFPRIKRPGRGFHQPPTFSSGVEERVRLYLYSLLGRRGLFYGKIYLKWCINNILLGMRKILHLQIKSMQRRSVLLMNVCNTTCHYIPFFATSLRITT
jgi:hypothetical protein